jgi:hypothetical protein
MSINLHGSTTPEIDSVSKETEIDILDILKSSMEKHYKHKLGNSIQISQVDNEQLNKHMDSVIGTKTISAIGIHTAYVFDYLVSSERLSMEYTALCWLSENSRKYEKLFPWLLNHEERLNTSQSLIVLVSYRAYQMFECLKLGIQLLTETENYKRAKEKGEITLMMVINSSIGQLQWPSEEDKDNLFQKSRWTRDILKAYNILSEIRLDKKKLYMSTRNLRLGEHFYVQSTGDWS